MYETTPHVGIEAEELSGVEVAPNPAHGFVLIEGVGEKPATIRVVDVMGRNVLVCEVTPASNMIDVRSLAPGFYVMLVSSAGGVSSMRLVIE